MCSNIVAGNKTMLIIGAYSTIPYVFILEVCFCNVLHCNHGLTSQCQDYTIIIKVIISSAFELSTKLEFYDRFVFIGKALPFKAKSVIWYK